MTDRSSKGDWDLLYYAVGILLGIADRLGPLDVLIYHNSYRVKIEVIGREMTKKDLGL